MDQFFLQVFEVVVIQSEAALQRPVGYPPLALEELNNLLQNVIERHNRSAIVSRSFRCLLVA
jgi:hypothetical protein